MNNLEKYLDQVIEQKPVVYEPPAEAQEPPSNVLNNIRRRWYIVLAATLAICAIGLPVIWYFAEPVYVVRGTVRVRQAVPSVLGGEAKTGEMGSYGQLVNTMAYEMMNLPELITRILDDLGPRDMDFLSGRPSSRVERLLAKIVPFGASPQQEQILKEAIIDREITASHLANTDLIAVTMRSHNEAEARTIVDSFLRNFRSYYETEADKDENETITMLENQRKELDRRVESQRAQRRAAAALNAPTVLDPNQELGERLEMNRLSLLINELTRLEAQRISLEAEISAFDPNHTPSTPEQIVTLRTAYVNADPMMAELSRNIVQMERDLIVAKQTQKGAHPLLQQKQEVLDALIARRDEAQRTLEAQFDEERKQKVAEDAEQRRKLAPERLRQIEARIVQVNQMLDEQQKKTTTVVQKKLDLQDLGVDLELDQEMLSAVIRRLGYLQMEQDRRGRVEAGAPAQRIGEEDKRGKYIGMTLFGALACGVGLALLRDKMDKTLQTPADVARQTDLPILGTTTSSRTVKPALFAEQIAGDYQTIRTNLGLLYNGGMPKRLVISSAGAREGKTTFAVNLATSLAKSGKKVLLIDGDLRKPDIGSMLNVLNDTGGLQNVLLGEDPGHIVCVLPTSGLHVLAANPRYLGDAYELLTSSTAAEQMERLSRDYDHLVVDSPPALAFPDALVWAKLTDAVILVTFTGRTTAPDLREAKERFSRIRARILGAIVSNVPVDQGLYRHSLAYRSGAVRSGRKGGQPKKLLLSTSGQENGNRPRDAEP